MAREISVGDASITFKTSYGAVFDIETRKEWGIAVRLNGKPILDYSPTGKKTKVKA